MSSVQDGEDTRFSGRSFDPVLEKLLAAASDVIGKQIIVRSILPIIWTASIPYHSARSCATAPKPRVRQGLCPCQRLIGPCQRFSHMLAVINAVICRLQRNGQNVAGDFFRTQIAEFSFPVIRVWS